MHEVAAPTIIPSADAIAEIADELARLLRPEIPSWVGAEFTIGQFRLVGRLARHGTATVGEIATWLGVGLPAASQALERLERHGLLERRHSLTDRRIVDVRLTDRGRELVAQSAGVRLEAIGRVLAVLEPVDRTELERILRLAVQRLQEDQP